MCSQVASYLCITKFSSRLFSQGFTQKNCGVKIVLVMNQPDPELYLLSMDIFSGKTFFLLNELKILTITDLVEISKSGTLSRKILISKSLRSGMHTCKTGMSQDSRK